MRLLARLTTLVALAAFLVGIPALVAAQATPTSEAVRIYELPGDAVFPEGVAYREDLPELADRFYVGSTEDGTIYQVDIATGTVDIFSEGGADGRNTAVGMHLSETHLYVAGGGTGTVFVYDVETGELAGSFSNGMTQGTFLNDLAILPNGDAIVTDSFNPVLYRVPGDALTGGADGQLEPWLDLTDTEIPYSEGFNLNGIVATPDGAALYTVQSNTGMLFRLDVETQEVTRVVIDAGGQLQGGDGLVLDESTLYVVREGVVTVVQLTPDAGSANITGTFSDPSFSTPTTAAKAGSCLLVVNSQFANRGGTPTLPFTVSLVPIPAQPDNTELSGSPEAVPVNNLAGSPEAGAMASPVAGVC